MAFGIGRVTQAVNAAVSKLAEDLPELLDRSLANIRPTIDTTFDAAQRTRDYVVVIVDKVDAIQSELQGLRADIARIGASEHVLREIANLRTTVEALAVQIAPPLAPPPGPDATPGEATEDNFEELLALAAGIAYAEISCHRDTWDFLVAQSSRGQHFRLPGAVDEDADGLIDADISGRTLIAVLDALRKAQRGPESEAGTRHLAAKIYNRIGDALARVGPGGVEARRHPQGESTSRPDVTRIVIDDRPAPPTDRNSD